MTDYDKINQKILASTPVDRVAARIMSKSREYCSPPKDCGCEHFAIMPPVRVHFSYKEYERRNPRFVNLKGQRIGRLTVLGLWAEKKRRWVVRCDCGDYEIRTSKSLKNPNTSMCCRRCYHWEQKKSKNCRATKGREGGEGWKLN